MAAAFPNYEYFNVSMPADYVAHVEINRPTKLNSFIEPMWLELRTVFLTLSYSANVRAILLTGSGPRAFTTGLDVAVAKNSPALSSSPNEDPARKATANRRHIADFQSCISAIANCEKPVVAALHGFSYGLALDIASACDVRFCAADTRFCVKEVDIGLAADIGTLSRLPKVVGRESWVKDVCLSAREFGAEEALKVGFVNRVGGGKEEAVGMALEWAGKVAGKSPVAVQGTKEILNYSRDHSVEDGLRFTRVWNGAALQTSDVGRAMEGGRKKKLPTFEKL